MADIEKVIKALEHCTYEGNCTECIYYDRAEGSINCPVDNDALALLKEQQAEIERLQPKKGHWEMKPDPFGLFDEIPVCSVCGCTNDMRKKTAFCEYCGADMREGDGG